MKNSSRMARSSRRKNSSGGSVIVESALIFMVFVGMLLAAFDFGQFLFVHQALVERARFSARWGSVNGETDSHSITNMVLYNQKDDPPTGFQSYFGLTASNVVITTPDAGLDSYRLNLKIYNYHYSVLSPYIGGDYTGAPITVSVPLGQYN